MRSEPKDSQKGEMFIWKNEELQRAAQRSVTADSDLFRDELGVAETAGEEMDMSQNSEDECQADRTEVGMAMVIASIEKDGDVELALSW